MNAENALKLARRFIELPQEKRRLFLDGLREEGVDFSLLPIPAGVAAPDRDGLSHAQRRMWFLWQLDPHGAAYNLPMAVRLNGELGRAALQSAFDALVARHESLRTRFRQEGDDVRQHVLEPTPVAIGFEDLTALSSIERERHVATLAEAEALAPFDLAEGPLLRVRLLKLAEREHVLLLTLHHIVADGWSLNLLIDEFLRLYDAACAGADAALSTLPIQYRDYALWQRSWLEAGEQERQLAYWRDKLGDEHAPMELPTDRSRPAVSSHRGARHEFQIDARLADRLRALARRHNVTLFMVLLAAFKLLLQRYSGQSAIRVGVPIANRHRAEVEGLIGCFINTQVLHTEIDPLIDVAELLRRVRETALGAQGHQDLPFEVLVEDLQPERSLNHSPLFQVMFNHQANVANVGELGSQSGLIARPLHRESRIAQFDLSLDTYEQNDTLRAAISYATDLFDAATIERLTGHWRNLLEAFCVQPEQPVCALPMLNAEEHRQIVYDWNCTQVSYPIGGCVHELIEVRVDGAPDAVALVFGEQALTYRELNSRANRLAHKLRELGVGPDVLVGIAVERSPEMVIGLLAVLKAGGAYVPLDPEYPRERLAHMMEDSGIGLLLTQTHLVERLPIPGHVQSLCLDQEGGWLGGYGEENLANQSHPENLAYVIYTSGSTGRPKGVAIRRGALLNHMQWMQERFRLHAQERVLQKTSFSFDASVWEFWLPLLAGAQLHLAPPELLKDLPGLWREVQRRQIAVLQLAPSLLQAALPFASQQNTRSLRLLFCGGEALSASLVRQLSLHWDGTPINLYGPTEATIDACVYPVEIDGTDSTVPIGHPIANARVHILDTELGPCPVGCVGELFISGDSLARGYHQHPGMTAERFIPDPFDEQGGGRLYRTGDLARYRADGLIEYVGRTDNQVKIRGFRIELSEIEAGLLEQEAVREAVVMAQEGPGGKQLVGYVVPSGPVPMERHDDLREAFRAALKQRLPDYMVPARLLFLESLPLTPHGKLDRKALPHTDASQSRQAHMAPRTELEQQVAAIWAEVLKIERVGLTDNFFELGGHSLLATQVVVRIRERLGIDMALRELFELPTLADFSLAIQQKTAHTEPLQDELAKSLEALKRLTAEEIDELIS